MSLLHTIVAGIVSAFYVYGALDIIAKIDKPREPFSRSTAITGMFMLAITLYVIWGH